MPAGPGRVGRPADQARQHLRALLTSVVADAGFDLEDVSVSTVGRRSLVRVVVDADGGVDLDAVAEVSRVVSAALDADTPGGTEFAGPYVLEVTSPGVDRPLTETRHWRRAAGRLVRVDVDGAAVTARVLGADGTGVDLDVAGTPQRVAWTRLGRGTVQIEFTRPGSAGAEHGEE